jgi:PPP family 3-phenylpropionic acid transporter
MSPQRPLRLAALFYFIYFGAAGIYLPFINLYFDKIGLSGREIGLLAAMPPLLGFGAGPLWGALGDRFHIHRRLLPIAVFGAIVPTLLFLRARDAVSLAVLVALAAIFSGPVVGLIDSAVLDLVHGTARTYGGIRWWGSLGFTVFTWITGYVLKLFGLEWMFFGYALLLALAGVAALGLPARRQVWHLSYQASLGQLVRQRPLLLFMCATFLIGATLAAMYAFYPLYMIGLGGNPAWLGLAAAISAATEMPVLFYSGRIFRRFGLRKSLMLACLLFFVRWGTLAIVTTPVPALLTSLLHGLTFAVFLSGSVAFVETRTPAGLHATAQAMFNAVFFGFGAALGALGGGLLYDAVGARGLFGVTAVMALVAVGFVFIAGESPRQPVSQTAPDPGSD